LSTFANMQVRNWSTRTEDKPSHDLQAIERSLMRVISRTNSSRLSEAESCDNLEEDWRDSVTRVE